MDVVVASWNGSIPGSGFLADCQFVSDGGWGDTARKVDLAEKLFIDRFVGGQADNTYQPISGA